MTVPSFLALLGQKWKNVVLTGLIFGSFAFFALVVFSKSFLITTDFLVVQTGSEQQDFYSMLKSSEYLGKVFAESVSSEKFIGAVVETGLVNPSFLPLDPKNRLKEWEKTVIVSSNPDVGALHVAVYGDNDRETLHIAQAVGKVLTEKNTLFRSGSEGSVEVRTLSGPITERNPSIARMILISLAGCAFGVSLSLFVLAFRLERSQQSMISFDEANLAPLRLGNVESQSEQVLASESKSHESAPVNLHGGANRRHLDGKISFIEQLPS